MRAATARDQLLLEMDAARDCVNEAIAGLTDDQMSSPAIDGWSAKDHLTHIALWHELRFFELSRIARGGRAGFPVRDEAGVEHINQQFAANRRPSQSTRSSPTSTSPAKWSAKQSPTAPKTVSTCASMKSSAPTAPATKPHTRR